MTLLPPANCNEKDTRSNREAWKSNRLEVLHLFRQFTHTQRHARALAHTISEAIPQTKGCQINSSVSISLSLYLSIYLFIYLSIYLSISLSLNRQ